MIYLGLLVIFFLLEEGYFALAYRYNIVDRPNARSSHAKTTLRGGGVIFPIAIMCWYFLMGYQYSYFVLGLLMISAISFVDDIRSISSALRGCIHLIAISCLLIQSSLAIPFYWYPVIFVFILGTINAYNFMDGINGITGAYSLITLITLYYINEQIILFTQSSLLLFLIVSTLVFNFYNFRKNAKCFAGDVGSIGIAFTICFFILQLIVSSNNYLYILLLFIYGLDTVTTIFLRVKRKENVLEPHRSHLYQYLANEKKWAHLLVTILYVVLQAIVNILLILCGSKLFTSNSVTCLFVISLMGLFGIVSLRIHLEGATIYLNKNKR